LPRPFKQADRRKRQVALIAALATVFSLVLYAGSAVAAQTASPTATVADTLGLSQSASSALAAEPTLTSSGSSDMASLRVLPARMSCSQLAKTTTAGGQKIQIVEYQTASASAGAPAYCAVTGHINAYIGFEILLPVSTWRQRYLQVGCGGLCGSISISPPQTTGYKPLADGDFVLAAEDDGHSGNGTTWSTNGRGDRPAHAGRAARPSGQ
jgi:feruloyl esterase